MNRFKKLWQKNQELNKTIEMAKSISKQFKKEPTRFELFLGWLGFILTYGVGIGFGIYMIVKGIEKYG